MEQRLEGNYYSQKAFTQRWWAERKKKPSTQE